MSTLSTTNLKHPSSGSNNIVLAADGSATAQLSSINGGPLAGTRNRIINGDMRIDQRNAGASITPVDGGYTLDRWAYLADQASKCTIEQTVSGVSAPAGFTDYLGVTSTAATTITTNQQFSVVQRIEGYNMADFAWGTASAKTITLSFWVRSSLTGTFGGALRNDAGNYNYPFSYTISSADTWEQKSVTITGATSGTWLTTNGRGMQVAFSLGASATLSGTAGAWTTSNFWSATGATQVLATNGATFYITGVQLEPGTVATPFERRSFGQELALCQRYFQKNGVSGSAWLAASKSRESDRQRHVQIQYPTVLRATPSITLNVVNTDGSTNSFGVSSITAFGAYVNILATADGQIPQVQIYSVSAEL
jgi:hypothetical protein